MRVSPALITERQSRNQIVLVVVLVLVLPMKHNEDENFVLVFPLTWSSK
jgi:hypothetical protein